MLTHEPNNWIVYFSYANKMAEFCRYDEAIEYYHKARPLRPKPVFIDCEEALSDLYELKKDFVSAIEMQREIIQIMKNDWSELEGEGIDMHLREIERLKQYLH